ncbi:MinD/ParA family ATP-binding protein [Mycobacterium attenuatum]|uniref:MinD/ParA family ATP-binding protein n=1 Tax=Mycobacterium attenuatum TaxID=2341086 RepID=UPI000F017C44|nr:MinD/ParA family protein [Mycobacterium attenuatum]VBA62472.1 ESX-1 secretion-associated protein EspI [Mycobacterium attenuatum]
MSANEREFLVRIGASSPQQPASEPPAHEANGSPTPPAAPALAGKFSPDSADTGPIPIPRGGAHRVDTEQDPEQPDGFTAAQPRTRVPLHQQPPAQPDQHTSWAGAEFGEDYGRLGLPDTAAQRWAASASGARAHSPQAPRYQVKAADLTPRHTRASSRGWRKWLYKTSFGAINVGESADEIELRQLNTAIKSPLAGAHSVTVVGGKGGAGKTSLTSAVASVFADVRKKDPVLAADADPTQAANLPDRIAPQASASFSDVIAGKELHRNADLRNFVGQNTDTGLDVLAGPARANGTGELDAHTYTQAHQRLQLLYNLLFTDTAVDFRHPVMAAVLDHSDSLVLVASAAPEGLTGAVRALDWLERAGYGRFFGRMVLVINHIRVFENRRARKETKRLVADMRAQFANRMAGERIFEVPYDSHIAEAGVLELERLAPKTRRELLKICAAIASGFGSEARR